MRKQILFFCLVLGICFVSLTHSTAINAVSNSQEIPLKGEFQSKSFRSLLAPIFVKIQDDFLFAYFQEHIGELHITIINEIGEVVYEEAVNAAEQPALTISLDGLPEGKYEIVFSNSNLNLKGEFEL